MERENRGTAVNRLMIFLIDLILVPLQRYRHRLELREMLKRVVPVEEALRMTFGTDRD